MEAIKDTGEDTEGRGYEVSVSKQHYSHTFEDLHETPMETIKDSGEDTEGRGNEVSGSKQHYSHTFEDLHETSMEAIKYTGGKRSRKQASRRFEDLERMYTRMCEYMTYGDLINVAQVCRSLKWAVRSVLHNRGPEIQAIYMKKYWERYLDDGNVQDPHPNRPIQNIVHARPIVACLFAKNHDCPFGNIFNIFKYQESVLLSRNPFSFIPSTFSLVGQAVVIDDVDMDGANNDTAGVFFPETWKVRVESKIISKKEIKNCSDDRQLGDLLKTIVPSYDMNSTNPRAMLLFIRNLRGRFEVPEERMLYEKLLNMVYGELNDRLAKPRRFALWGAEVRDVANARMELHLDDVPVIVGITISGEVHAWSVVIDLRQEASRIRKNLQNFKATVNIRKKSNSIALAAISSDAHMESHTDRLRKVQEFRDVFPDIRLMTFALEMGLKKFGLNSTENPDENTTITFVSDCVCFMLLNYD